MSVAAPSLPPIATFVTIRLLYVDGYMDLVEVKLVTDETIGVHIPLHAFEALHSLARKRIRDACSSNRVVRCYPLQGAEPQPRNTKGKQQPSSDQPERSSITLHWFADAEQKTAVVKSAHALCDWMHPACREVNEYITRGILADETCIRPTIVVTDSSQDESLRRVLRPTTMRLGEQLHWQSQVGRSISTTTSCSRREDHLFVRDVRDGTSLTLHRQQSASGSVRDGTSLTTSLTTALFVCVQGLLVNTTQFPCPVQMESLYDDDDDEIYVVDYESNAALTHRFQNSMKVVAEACVGNLKALYLSAEFVTFSGAPCIQLNYGSSIDINATYTVIISMAYKATTSERFVCIGKMQTFHECLVFFAHQKGVIRVEVQAMESTVQTVPRNKVNTNITRRLVRLARMFPQRTNRKDVGLLFTLRHSMTAIFPATDLSAMSAPSLIYVDGRRGCVRRIKRHTDSDNGGASNDEEEEEAEEDKEEADFHRKEEDEKENEPEHNKNNRALHHRDDATIVDGHTPVLQCGSFLPTVSLPGYSNCQVAMADRDWFVVDYRAQFSCARITSETTAFCQKRVLSDATDLKSATAENPAEPLRFFYTPLFQSSITHDDIYVSAMCRAATKLKTFYDDDDDDDENGDKGDVVVDYVDIKQQVDDEGPGKKQKQCPSTKSTLDTMNDDVVMEVSSSTSSLEKMEAVTPGASTAQDAEAEKRRKRNAKKRESRKRDKTSSHSVASPSASPSVSPSPQPISSSSALSASASSEATTDVAVMDRTEGVVVVAPTESVVAAEPIPIPSTSGVFKSSTRARFRPTVGPRMYASTPIGLSPDALEMLITPRTVSSSSSSDTVSTTTSVPATVTPVSLSLVAPLPVPSSGKEKRKSKVKPSRRRGVANQELPSSRLLPTATATSTSTEIVSSASAHDEDEEVEEEEKAVSVAEPEMRPMKAFESMVQSYAKVPKHIQFRSYLDATTQSQSIVRADHEAEPATKHDLSPLSLPVAPVPMDCIPTKTPPFVSVVQPTEFLPRIETIPAAEPMLPVEPMVVVAEPMVTVKPMTATEPMVVVAEPMVVVAEPMVVVAEPMVVVAEPPHVENDSKNATFNTTATTPVVITSSPQKKGKKNRREPHPGLLVRAHHEHEPPRKHAPPHQQHHHPFPAAASVHAYRDVNQPFEHCDSPARVVSAPQADHNDQTVHSAPQEDHSGDVLTPFPVSSDPAERSVTSTTIPLHQNSLVLPRSIVQTMQELVRTNMQMAETNRQMAIVLREQQSYVKIIETAFHQYVNLHHFTQPAFEYATLQTLQAQERLFMQFRQWGYGHLWEAAKAPTVSASPPPLPPQPPRPSMDNSIAGAAAFASPPSPSPSPPQPQPPRHPSSHSNVTRSQ